MQSKISYFNATLFRKNLARYWPLWGGASILGALVPLAALVDLIHHGWGDQTPMDSAALLYSGLTVMVPVISLVYAILCALAVWNYLFNARSVSLMHTLPITRKGLFITNTLSGLAMMLVPYAVTGALTILVMLMARCFAPVAVLATILGVAGESLFYFATATLVAFCTGNVFAMAGLYFILHFLADIVEFLLTAFFGGFYCGVSGVGIHGFAGILSPTTYIMAHVDYDTSTIDVMTDGGYILTMVDKVWLVGEWVIVLYAAIGAAFLVCAWLLYSRRRSESAGDVVAVNWMKPIFRYGAAFCAAMAGGLALYALFWADFQQGNRYSLLPMILFTAVAGVVGYYIASMLLAKSLRVFKSRWKGAAVTALACAALCVGTSLDPLGIEARQPAPEDIDSVYISISSNNYVSADLDDPAAIQEVLDAHSRIIGELDNLEKQIMLRNTYGGRTSSILAAEEMDWCSISIRYYLENGKTMYRYYSFFYPTVDQQDWAGGLIPSLARLASLPAIQQANIFGDLAGQKNVAFTGGRVEELYDPEKNEMNDVVLNDAETQILLEAVSRDIEAGHFGKTVFQEDSGDLRYYSRLYFFYTYDEQDNRGQTYTGSGIINSLGVSVYCTETVAALKSLGVVDKNHQILTEQEWEEISSRLNGMPYDYYAYDGYWEDAAYYAS